MSIYKRGNIWWYSFRFNGQRVQRTTRQPDRNAALAIEAAARTALAKGDAGISDREPCPRLAEFAQRFLDNCAVGRSRAPGESTIAFYAGRLNRLLACQPLASSHLNTITPELIQRYIKTRQPEVGPACINRELATLRRCLRVAVDLGLLSKPTRITLLPGERVREFVLSPSLEAAYLDGAPQPLKDAAVVMLETGLRVSEVCRLDWPDVYLEPVGGATCGYVRVRGTKSRNAQRTIPLTQRAHEVLSKRQGEAKTVHVFNASVNGSAVSRSTLSHQHTAWRRALRMPPEFVVHSFRHTMLTRLGASGADAFTIKRIAGHSSVTVSEKYVHPTPELLQLTFRKFEDL